MLSLTFSNRYEVLLEILLARLDAERPGPFGQRQIIVPSAALRRGIELAIAERESIAANLRFAYPAGWLWSAINRVIPVGEQSPFAPAQLRWHIFDLLGESWTGRFPRLARYLEHADALMRFELAERIARLFDDYITYRPQWLAHWAGHRTLPGLAGNEREDEAWQAELWRKIRTRRNRLGLYEEHPANAFFTALEEMPVATRERILPASVHVFCLPSLPPLYLDMLRKLAQWMDVRMYTLNPCREYWFEIVPPRRLAWLLGQQSDLYHESGNRLLAGWGRQTQAHIDLLFEGDSGASVEDSLFVDAADSDCAPLLAQLQDALLNMADPPPGSLQLAEHDRSIEVHVCHSLLREIEVLHDRLLALHAAEQPPRPDEILVVTPDLAAAAPLIEAVFGAAPPHRRLPWRITGLGQTRINEVARALDMALSLNAGRFPVSALFELLQQPAVAQRFGMSPEALRRLQQWLRDAGVNWGLDGGQRDALGLPYDERHSLADGLHRLFLAYAGGDDENVFAGRTAAGNPEGGEAALLGCLWRYADTLQRLHDECAQPRDADGWRDILLSAVDALTPATMEWADDVRAVRLAIDELHTDMLASGMRSLASLEVIHTALNGLLDDPARGGIPGGAVTFSTMSGLRSLPYRVVCIIGLDDGAFPGNDRAAEFDLMASHPLSGDRQRRYDERNQFLDLLLAARDYVHLSYAGRSVRDNSEKPPSVLIDELLDYLSRACADDPHDPAAFTAARRRLTVEHPLQAFSRKYFVSAPGKDARLISFQDEYCHALQARRQTAPTENAAAVPFFSLPLSAPEPAWREVGLDALIRFFRHPSRFLLTERLGISLYGDEETLEDDETFIPDWHARRQLAQRLLPALLDGRNDTDIRELALASNIYPAGALGEHLLEHELAAMQNYAATLRSALADPPLPAVAARFDADMHGEHWTLSAELGDVRPAGLVRYRYDAMRAGDLLSGWLSHLALCIAAPRGVTAETCWHARNGIYRWKPVADAGRLFDDLLSLYRRGLCEPLPFFPKTAWAWFSNNRSRSQAEQKWHGGRHPEFGERNDTAIRLAFRDLPEPLDESFYTLAERIFAPLCAHLDEPEQAA